MSTKTSSTNAIQTKMINASSKVLPMHLQIKALKMLMKAKKKNGWVSATTSKFR